MANHYLGKRIDGRLTRFTQGFNDEQFEAMLERIGGNLPVGWVAWHFNDDETIRRSKRVQAVAKHPVIVEAREGVERWIVRDLEAQQSELVEEER